MFLTPSDFTGKYELHKGMYDTTKLQTYINKYETRYLRHLLGVDLYNQFIGDLTSGANPVPKSPNFTKIFNAFAEDVNMYSMIESDGMLEMLKGFIYFEYSKDGFMQQTTYGGVQQTAENSKVLTSLQSMIYARYNEAIRTYQAIQDYILLNTLQPTGQLVTLNEVSAGTNYTAFSGNGINLITMSKSVDSFNLTSGGSGYTNQVYQTSGGSGTGLSVGVTANGAGAITSAYVEVAGINYAVGDVVTILGGSGGSLTITAVYPTSVGLGGSVNFNAHNVGGVNQKSLTTGGNGYVASNVVLATSGGIGSGCTVQVTAVSAGGSGVVTAFSIVNQGFAYGVGNVLTIIGSGLATGCTFTITSIWNGQIYGLVVQNKGQDYKVGDYIGVPKPTLNGDARYSVAYAGKGDYGLFKGQRKGRAYWI
jgi:hypothetical protein